MLNLSYFNRGTLNFMNQTHPRFLPHMIFGLAAAFLFFEMALQVSPSVMVHDLMRDVHLDAASLGIMAGVYYYSYTLMQIPAGLLFDRLSSRKLITFSLLFCAGGAAFFGAAQTAYLAALGRFLMGLGSAFAFISVLFVASEWFPAKHFALLAGVAQFLAAVGAMGGEGPLAAAVSSLGWRATLWWMAAIGASIALIAWIVIRDHPHKTVPMNKIITMVMSNLRQVFGNRQTWVVALYSFAVWAPITAFAALWGVDYLSTYYHVSREVAANACAMVWLGIGLGSMWMGWWSDRLGKRRLPLLLCALLGIVTTSIILYAPGVSLWMMVILLFLFGIASSGQALSFAVVKENNPLAVTGTAIGFNNMAVVSGGALFQPIVGLLLRHHSQGLIVNGAPVYHLIDYRYALVVMPICYLLGALSLFWVRETNCQNTY